MKLCCLNLGRDLGIAFAAEKHLYLSVSTQLDEEQYARADLNGGENKDMLDVFTVSLGRKSKGGKFF